MKTVRRAPIPVLAPFVASLGYFEGEFAHAREARVPTGCLQLVVNLYEDRVRWYDGPGYATGHTVAGTVLCGTTPGPVGIDTADQRAVVCVAFRPGGGYPFFVPPAAELNDPVVPLDALWGPAAARLRERLLAAPTPRAALAVIEQTLCAQAIRPLEADPTVAAAVRGLERGLPVAAVTERLGGSQRTLVRRFAAQVGLSPKRFARLRRMHRLLASLPGRAHLDWAGLAVEHGYFDQAHLIHDFRAITGTTPGGYRPRRPEDHNHLPL